MLAVPAIVGEDRAGAGCGELVVSPMLNGPIPPAESPASTLVPGSRGMPACTAAAARVPVAKGSGCPGAGLANRAAGKGDAGPWIRAGLGWPPGREGSLLMPRSGSVLGDCLVWGAGACTWSVEASSRCSCTSRAANSSLQSSGSAGCLLAVPAIVGEDRAGAGCGELVVPPMLNGPIPPAESPASTLVPGSREVPACTAAAGRAPVAKGSGCPGAGLADRAAGKGDAGPWVRAGLGWPPGREGSLLTPRSGSVLGDCLVWGAGACTWAVAAPAPGLDFGAAQGPGLAPEPVPGLGQVGAPG